MNGCKQILLGFTIFLSLSGAAFAQGGDAWSVGSWRQNPMIRPFGVGAMVGEPTGLNMKYWANEVSAVDLGLAWAFNGQNSFQIHADYLLHDRSLININGEPVTFYFGIGPRFKFDDNETLFGARIPVGLSYMFEDQPIDISAEVAPILELAPDTDLALNLGVTGRYYF